MTQEQDAAEEARRGDGWWVVAVAIVAAVGGGRGRGGPNERIASRATETGTQATVQDVPHSRVLDVCFYNRDPGSAAGAFLGNRESEFLVIPYGVRFDQLK